MAIRKKTASAGLKVWTVAELGAFYTEHRSELVAHASRILKDSARAEEVIQDALIKVMLAAPELESADHALGYMRRTLNEEDDALIRVGDLSMDQDTHEVFLGSIPIDLSPTEFKLLRYLMLNPNRVLSKAQILDHVWEYDFNGDAGIVESYVSYLRRKLDPHTAEPLIQTKRGFGYMLKSDKA